MFTLDTTIDAIQTAKKTFVTTFVTNQKIADSLNSFVDAQTEYTKRASKAATDSATAIGKELTNVVQDAMKFDFAKFTSAKK